MIVLNTVHQEYEWPDAFVTRLRVLGETLVGALERQALFEGVREAEERALLAADGLRASEARLASAVELAGLGFYEGNFAEGVMYVDDRFCDLCAIPADHRQGLQAAGRSSSSTSIRTTSGARDGHARAIAQRAVGSRVDPGPVPAPGAR